MDRVRGPRPASGRARSAALLTGLVGLSGLALAGCHATGTTGTSPGTASAAATTDVGAIDIAPSS